MTALRLDFALPSGVAGPVDFCAFSRFAARRLFERVVVEEEVSDGSSAAAGVVAVLFKISDMVMDSLCV